MAVDVRLSEIAQIEGVINRSSENLFIDDGTNAHRMLLNQLVGSGSGAANTLCYKEEITEITDDMWDSISSGAFDLVHTGMHYTAPSGRTYYLAHADYYFGYGGTEQTNHHYLVIEDEINHTAQHQTTNTTVGGAASSLIYITTLPSIQGELETDFGADHILPQSVYLTNAVSSGVASAGAWTNLYSHLLTEKQVTGNDIRYTDGSGYFLNFYTRERQLALFANMPETVIARLADTTSRKSYWTDTVESAAYFGYVGGNGFVGHNGASGANGVRRAFLIG